MDPKNPNYWACPDYDEPRYSECEEDFDEDEDYYCLGEDDDDDFYLWRGWFD